MAKKRKNNPALVTLFFATSTIIAVLGIAAWPKINSCMKVKNDYFACAKFAVSDFKFDEILPKAKTFLKEPVINQVEPPVAQPITDEEKIELPALDPEEIIEPAELIKTPKLEENINIEVAPIPAEQAQKPKLFDEITDINIVENQQEPEVLSEDPKEQIVEQGLEEEQNYQEKDLSVFDPMVSSARVEAGNILVIEGSGQPGDFIEVFANAELIGNVKVKAGGDWIAITKSPYIHGSNLEISKLPITAKNDQSTMVIMSDSLNSRPLTIFARRSQQEDMAAELVSDEAKISESIEYLASIVRPYLSIDMIKIDEDNNFFAGRGENDLIVQLFVDDKLIADTIIFEGRWQINLDENILIKPNQKVRFDFLKSKEQGVFATVDVDFFEDNQDVESNVERQPNSSNQIVVKKGDTLWDLSKHLYGNGYRYKLIFEANRGKINDSHWIYPGQILELPSQARY